MLAGIARLALTAPRRILAVALFLMVAGAIFGGPVAGQLSGGGFRDPSSESARASALLADKFQLTDMQMLITVSTQQGVYSEPARAVGTEILDGLERSPHVALVDSPWRGPPEATAELVSKDGNTGLIVAGILGGNKDAPAYAKTLSDELVRDRDGVAVRAGGSAAIDAQLNEQTEKDLLLMESVAIPLSFLVLVVVFGGVLAAALPLAVGVLAIVGTMAVLRAFTLFTDVSIFALNLTVAMGLALAIDYSLLILSRYRDERHEGVPRDIALFRTILAAGRTVIFSATVVALSMLPMALFPMYFLRSFAYAGVAVVAFAALAAVVVVPAAIVVLGDRLDAFDIRRLIRRMLGRAEPVVRDVDQTFWYRSTKKVMRRAIPVGLAVTALLLMLGAPFLGVRWGFPDDRVLPTSAQAHEVGDQLRNEFATNSATNVTVAIPDTAGDEGDLARYAAELSQVPDVSTVWSPVGTFVAGQLVAPPSGPAGQADGTAYLTVASTAPLFSDASDAQLDRLHSVAPPNGQPALLTGTAQVNRDIVSAVMSRLPTVLAGIAVVTFVLLFLLTGSLILPVKTLVLNVLSLSAAFGALVWIFQDGHLGAFGTTVTGTLAVTVPVLLFCIAFGLSMDYQVFLLSRIREFWIASGQTRADNDESVARGLGHTGRVVSAAAAIMSISFAALIASHVSFMRMLGLGLTVAVLMDATLVRMVLVPAFMRVLGRANWWAPKPLSRLHARFGFTESRGTGRHAATHRREGSRAPGPASTKERPVDHVPLHGRRD